MDYLRLMLALAIVPAALLLIRVYRLDRIEKEPIGMLLKLLLCGALATIPAVILEEIGAYLINGVDNELVAELVENFVVVAVAEEGSKYFFLKKMTWKFRQFNCSFDGIVYAVFVSLGFAILENVEYVFSYGIVTALLRAVTAIPGHCCFGILMGTQYSLARYAENYGRSELSKSYRIRSLLFPILIHGAYDFLAGYTEGLGMIGFFAVLVVVYVVDFTLIKRCAQRDHIITRYQSWDIPIDV